MSEVVAGVVEQVALAVGPAVRDGGSEDRDEVSLAVAVDVTDPELHRDAPLVDFDAARIRETGTYRGG